MSENEKTSIKTLRNELDQLDAQIEKSKELQKVLEEERRPFYQVYQWEAPERIQPTKDNRFYLVGSATALFVVVLSLLTNNYGLVIAVIALVLLLYALNTVPPAIAKHELTNKGLSLFGTLYSWKTIETYWISERSGNKFLNLEVTPKPNKPTELIIAPFGDGDIFKVISYMAQFVDYLPENEIRNNFFKNILDGTTLTFGQVVGKGKSNELDGLEKPSEPAPKQ